MNPLKQEEKIHYTLRIASAMCLIGHGVFGVITKKIWLNYFGVFGIDPPVAYRLMPWLGAFDICLGVFLLFYPTKGLLSWLVVWGTITALLRPVSGEPFAEAIERAGNYGAPLTMLILYGVNWQKLNDWFAGIDPATSIAGTRLQRAETALRIIVFLLLAGHGWLNILGKQGLLDQYGSLGFSQPKTVALILGTSEIIGAVIILVRPLKPVILVVLVWKMGTELFYPHWEIFEWIERGGSYGTILALYYIVNANRKVS